MPESRRLLAVPFIGKDVPSAASEFAHPEVLIGLTILSYRYEGMRDSDMFHVLEQMKESLKQELGPFPDRPSGIRFTSWLTRANILRSSKGLKELETDVPPLQLFQPRDKKQMRAACILLSNLSEVSTNALILAIRHAPKHFLVDNSLLPVEPCVPIHHGSPANEAHGLGIRSWQRHAVQHSPWLQWDTIEFATRGPS